MVLVSLTVKLYVTLFQVTNLLKLTLLMFVGIVGSFPQFYDKNQHSRIGEQNQLLRGTLTKGTEGNERHHTLHNSDAQK